MMNNKELALKTACERVFGFKSEYFSVLIGFIIGALAPLNMTSFLLMVALWYPFGILVETTKAYKKLR